ncbi:similar to Saccharomyces cerevisiae YPL008W CHL1 Probable DNA helicase involved in sister-chromatid cohesion and genome integrity [Maudiozyma saulgeensis]|uniref:ATP-dependent DNA helicase CHL1 n=1 Tax=Maudiozyma saulgeensis TaxID=1789683 RepID=A0A1X7R0Z4_9SACH|nr:similar to Saccharomyces cerevisiae YPL008W CHL1 Probable DNA helicase involved in sister-chromatid cohesion and genome integrity [Kazachstania saulgeensis]
MTNRFHHPYTPYDIQVELMESLYDKTLNSNKKIALVESPTGTGKTLSLICAVVTWLRDNKSKLIKDEQSNKSITTTNNNSNNTDSNSSSDDESESESEPEWVVEAFNDSRTNDTITAVKDFEKYLDSLPEPISNMKILELKAARNGPKRKVAASGVTNEINDNDLLPEEQEIIETKKQSLNQEVKQLLNKLDQQQRKQIGQSDQINEFDKNHIIGGSPIANPVKIYFASRTHSQLSQFAHQLQLPEFPSSFKANNLLLERIKFLPLGSKKQLCIEPSVKRWKTAEAINDACYDLRHSKNGCPFYSNTPQWHASEDTITFRDNLYKEIHDIEDLVPLGESLKVCPYYASRDSIPGAEIISLPYQYLLSNDARESLGIDLDNSIVIVDEAHNLIDTINNIYSASMTYEDLMKVLKGLNNYLIKFEKKLGPRNRVNLLKLLKLLETIKNFIDSNFKKPGQRFQSYEILNNSNSDLFNIHKLIDYVNKSKVAYKIDTYMTRTTIDKNEQKNNTTTPSSTNVSKQPALFKIMKFLTTLTHPSKEGQFFFEKDKEIKYMLLEPSKMLEPIVKKARCLILAGGTMEPLADFYNELFPQIDHSDILTFSCNHVIPDKNLQTFIIDDPNFEFTFAKRNSAQLINNNLFNFYNDLSHTVPITGGIVGFFPSYQYLQFVIDHWTKSGKLKILKQHRKLFYERKDGEDILSDYINTVSKGEGAILFAIVGGRLSEGINFQDNLCRAVVMTGLPFPNVFSGELQIKKDHLEEKIKKNGGSQKDAQDATREFYETICMKAVNQSVGRAIRHANDYAAIYLLDKRYATENIKQKLSLWVRKRIQQEHSVPMVMNKTSSFFQSMNQ